MKEDPNLPPPKKDPEKTGLALFGLVGGFVFLIIVIGWIIVASRGGG
jgi:hypothetical protein